MAALNRKLQREILELLAKAYPGIASIRPGPNETIDEVHTNLYYLTQHGLVDVPWTLMMSGRREPGTPCITAKGLDFLADDGGLSAILGVVTVKLHDDTIRQLLIDKIEKADGDQTIKEQLVKKVKELPAEALGTITMTSLSAALDQIPGLLPFFGKLFSAS